MASSWWLIEEKERAYEEGEAIGETKGERRVKELFRRLKEADRMEDAIRASTDEEYCRKLYEEFEI